MSPSAIITEQSPIQHTLDPDSKITLGNLSPGRLSPNLFLGINLDPNSMDRNNLSFEWTSYTSPSTSSTVTNNHQQHFQHRSTNNDPNCLNMDENPYDDIKFLNTDQFNMESYKSDCILNIDPNTMLVDDQQKQHNIIGLDLHNFTFDDDDGIDKSSPLLDLERPLINITVQNIGEKY